MAGQALYYGMNALSHNVIMADRKKLKSANGMYLGSTGSGKSFAAKRELLNVFLTIPQDRIIVVDPMGEYAPLVRRLGGQVIEIAPDSPHHLNPMDVELNMAAGESPLSMKADFLLSLCELVVGGKEGLQPIEKTVIDRCVHISPLSHKRTLISSGTTPRDFVWVKKLPVASAIVCSQLSCQHDIIFRFLFIMCHAVSTIDVHALSKLSGRSST